MAFLEDYTLLDELGQGGYASVYKVRHNKLGYIRALRVLNATIALGEQDKTYQKFLEECRLLLRLGNGNHSNIVHIYQPLLKDMKAAVEMDFVDGKDLFHYVKDNNHFVETEDVLKLLSDISSALAYCHEDIYKSCMDRDEDKLKDDPNDGSKVLLDDETKQRLIDKYRVIHNDIHSGNIIRRENGDYVLLDFGLAINGNEVIRSSRRDNGAPEFKAPEKWDKNVLTTQSDIYSFGVVLYEFLAGRVPFPLDKKNSASAELKLMKAHQEQIPEPIFELRKAAFEASHPGQEYKKDYPSWLERVIMKCLEKSPSDRFKNGKELHDFVLEHIDDENKAQALAMEKEIADLQKQIEVLHNKFIAVSNEQNSEENEAQRFIKHLRSELKDLTKEKKDLEARVKALESESSELSERLHNSGNQRLMQELEILRSKIQRTELDLQCSENKLGEAEKVNRDLQRKIFMLTNKNGNKPDTLKWQIAVIALSVLCAILGVICSLSGSTSVEAEEFDKSGFITTYLDNSMLWEKEVMQSIDPRLGRLWEELKDGELNSIISEVYVGDPNIESRVLEELKSAIHQYKDVNGDKRFNDIFNNYVILNNSIHIGNYIKRLKGEEIITSKTKESAPEAKVKSSGTKKVAKAKKAR